jgi:UDP-N-acetylglucosamine 2-epimerase (non-hydrolysing)
MQENKKVFLIFGTRPEAIKMAPLFIALQKEAILDTKIILTGQHREMLQQVIELFNLPVSYDLSIMKENQSLEYVTSEVLLRLKTILEAENPDLVLVHGDTTTTFASALAAFYHQIPVGHVEAGLRTDNIYSPFPEEVNRRLTDRISTLYFAPTEYNKETLLRENIPEDKIYVTGNTVIDAFLMISKREFDFEKEFPFLDKNKKLIVLTAHRRENFGEKMENIFKSIKKFMQTHSDYQLVYPVHQNPHVKKAAYKIFADMERVYLIKPLSYLPFVHLLKNAFAVLTDSGGIQEEVPSLGIPVLVLRDISERNEAVEARKVDLIGTDPDWVLKKLNILDQSGYYYDRFSYQPNPYGDGKASQRIAGIIKDFLLKKGKVEK